MLERKNKEASMILIQNNIHRGELTLPPMNT